jgi:hypothetical protein
MTSYTPEWRAIVADLRSRFPGSLTFAANWTDGARDIGFWPDLDYIGIDPYMPLAWDDPNPSVESLTAAWCAATDPSGQVRRYVDEVAALHAQYDKPVVFTEIGYQSRLGTASVPWGDAPGAASDEPQQRAFEAAYRVWSRVPWFEGLYWWDWSAGTSSANPDPYTPEGRTAQAAMTAWNTSQGPPEPGSPCSAPGAESQPAPASTLITLKATLRRHGGRRHLQRLKGRAVQGHTACAQSVRVRIDRWSKRAHRWRRRGRLRAGTTPSGRYAVAPRHLRRGRYRARSYTSKGHCGRAHSRYAHFRVR